MEGNGGGCCWADGFGPGEDGGGWGKEGYEGGDARGCGGGGLGYFGLAEKKIT